MLVVDVRSLRQGPVETVGTLPPEDETFAGLGLQLAVPLAVAGRLQATAEGEYYWQGHIAGRVRTTCRRCLAEGEEPVEASVSVMFSADPDAADDPSVYPLEEHSRQVDLRPAIREELALAAPAFPLCRDDCAGLCPSCGADLNAGPCGCGSANQT